MKASRNRTAEIVEALQLDTRWMTDALSANAILGAALTDANILSIASMAPEKLLPAAAKSGFEDELCLELQDAAEGRKPKTDTWRLPFGGKNYYSGATSMNWTIMARAIRYSQGAPGAREELLAEEFPFQRKWFMGSETFSTCHKYGMMHVGAWALIAKRAHEAGDFEVATFADRWLLLWFCVQLMRESAPGEAVLIAGLRSAGHPASQGDLWARWLLALVLGGHGRDADAVEGMLKRAGMAPGKSYKKAVGLACAVAMGRACAPLAGRRPEQVAPREFGSIVPLVIRRSEEGLATWIQANANSNTGPVGASIVTAKGSAVGPVLVIPDSGGGRTRRNVVVDLRESGGRLVGTFDGEPVDLALPGGAVIDLFRMDAASGGVPAPVDPPPTAPVPGIDIESLVREVESLGAQPDQTIPAVALVRAQKWTEASMAVLAFGVKKKNQGARVALSDRLAKMAEVGR